MPVLEIVTGLLVTYASSEWLSGSKRRTFSSLLVLATLQAFSAVFGLLSSFEWPRLPMAVRVPLVALAFHTALYIDCVRHGPLPAGEFLLAVAEAFMRLMPLCPLLSVLIGASFLVVAQVCETLNLPTAWLNWPIYYCTLYGPCAFVYVNVKLSVKAAASTKKFLPV